MVAVTDALTLLEIFLINRNYVACDQLTIADLSILASVTLVSVRNGSNTGIQLVHSFHFPGTARNSR